MEMQLWGRLTNEKNMSPCIFSLYFIGVSAKSMSGMRKQMCKEIDTDDGCRPQNMSGRTMCQMPQMGLAPSKPWLWKNLKNV